MAEYRDMWVYAEQTNGAFTPVAKQMLSEARRLMDKYNADYNESEKVVAVVIGHKVDALAKEAIEWGADVTVQIDHPDLEHFSLEPYTKAVGDAATDKGMNGYDKPRYFVYPATNNGRDLSATVCAVLETGCASDCNLLYIEDAPIKHPYKAGPGVEKVFERTLHMKRPDFSGFEWSTILCLDNPDKDFHPQSCSVIPGSFEAEQFPGRKGEVKKAKVDLTDEVLRVKVRSRTALEKLDLSRDEMIVALGRGIGKNPTKGFQLGLDLAKKLDAEFGLSRGVITASYTVDGSVEQWLTEERQIGETGQFVKPKVYLALGISGAIQHKKGMDKSEFIVSINTDPDATIKDFSDLYIVGDLFEVTPKLAQAIDKMKGGAK